MAFIMELGDKSSGNMTLLQAGSTAVPGNLPATHLSVFIFLQGGWPWALYLGQTNWLQGKTWPWSLWERWAKEHPLKHLDSWHTASHINHMKGKKSQVRWEVYQDAHLLAFLDLWDSKEMLHKSQKYHNSYCWDCHLQEGLSVYNYEPEIPVFHFSCRRPTADSRICLCKLPCVLYMLATASQLLQALLPPVPSHACSGLLYQSPCHWQANLFLKGVKKPRKCVSLLITLRAHKEEASPGQYLDTGRRTGKTTSQTANKAPEAELRTTEMQSEKLEYVYRYSSIWHENG